MTRRLRRSFYARPAQVVARALIGKRLCHGQRSGIIVETEAYEGPEDAASHARFGPTARTAVMFGPAGYAYVYLCYGVHEMFNVVTGREGQGQAVLVRAIAVGGQPPATGRGPGKLTRALALSRAHDGLDLTESETLWIATGVRTPAIATSARIGVAYAGDWAAAPMRFYWDGHPAVSGPRARRPE